MEYPEDAVELSDIEPEWVFPPIPTDYSIYSQTLESTSARRGAGRLRHKSTDLLEMFTTKNGKFLKKEYVRVKFIRELKNLFRKIEKNQLGSDNNRNIRKLISLYKENEIFFREVAKTSTGPRTDGRARRQEHETTTHNTHSNNYARDFFATESIRESHYYLIENKFSDSSPETLQEELSAFCCRTAPCTTSCSEKWGKLKKYIQEDMISELGHRPFTSNFNETDLFLR